MRKIFKLMAFLVVACSFILFTSCSFIENGNSCKHEFSEWHIVKEATCLEDGLKERDCKNCDLHEELVIRALGHNFQEANCEHPKTCLNCGLEIGEKIGHVHNLEIVSNDTLMSEATCKEKAKYYYTCECGHISETEFFYYGELKEHNHNLEIVSKDTLISEATCKEKAKYYYTCECGHISETEFFYYGELKEHNHNLEIVSKDTLLSEATCKEKAKYYYTCECGDISKDESEFFYYGELKEHNHNLEIVSKDTLLSEATCKEKAKYYYTCECGDISKDKFFYYGELKKHDYKLIDHKEADCCNPITNKYECEHCLDTYTETIGDKLGHDIKDVTPYEKHINGCLYVLVYECNKCHNEVTGDEVYHHNYVSTIKKEATCLEDGVKELKCSCGDIKEEIILASTEYHEFVKGDVINGSRVDTCIHCHETKTVKVFDGTQSSLTNANDLKDTEIELNDTNISLDDGVIDTIGDKNIIINADTLSEDDKKNLGLTSEQLNQVGDNPIYNFTINDGTSNISQFGENNYATITLPYSLEEGEDIDSIAIWFINDNGKLESIKATYNNGFVTFKTNHFSYYTITKLTPKERCELYGHSFVKKEFVGDCTTDSYILEVCVRCHESIKTITKYALGHDYNVTITDPTCTECGYEHYECKNCDHEYKVKIQATGHSLYQKEVIDATCSKIGKIVYGCKDCDYETYEVIPTLKHDYEVITVLPTCQKNGYTLYQCKNCDHNYMTDITQKLGHSYDLKWVWEDDYSKAYLLLTCKNDPTHLIRLDANVTLIDEIEYSCCDYKEYVYFATLYYDNLIYSDKQIYAVGKLEHDYTKFEYNEEYHWYECGCGDKLDLEKHILTETIINEATCKDEGLLLVKCECGYEYSKVIEKTNDHNYVDGVCSVCGKHEHDCMHDILHEENVKIKDACGEVVIYYNTCTCGKVKLIDTDKSIINCDFDYTDNGTIKDESGNEIEYMVASCKCGLKMEAYYTEEKSGCSRIDTYTYNIYFNDELIIGDLTYKYEYERHNSVTDKIDLSGYGVCGGIIEVRKCKDCNKILAILNMDLDCDIDYDLMPEPITKVDDKGITHTVYEIKCEDCGLVITNDTYEIIYSACEKEIFMKIELKVNDTVIASTLESSYQSSHDYKYTYELNGDSCEDGYTVYAKCDICGDLYSYETSGHRNREFNEIISIHDGCECIINGTRCEICGTIDKIYYMDSTCKIEDSEELKSTDENGIVHYIILSKCSNCGLTYYQEMWQVKQSECVNITYMKIQVLNGEEVLFSGVMEETKSNHDWEYEYNMFGETCSDGYEIIKTCSKCGKTETEEWYGHFMEYFHISLEEHGGCYGNIDGNECKVCGKKEVYDYYTTCLFEDILKETYTDENQILHTVTKKTCSECGFIHEIDEYSTNISSCIVNKYQNIKIYSSKTNELIIEFTVEKVEEKHEIVRNITLNGDSCDDGYTVIEYCKNCDLYNRYEGSGHYIECEKISLEEFGLCGGMFYKEYCLICDEVLYQSIDDYGCCWEYVENEDGLELYECSHCHAIKKVLHTSKRIDNTCEYIDTYTYIYLLNGEELFRYEETNRYTSHDYEYEFILNGKTCLEGVTIKANCKYCNYSYEEHIDDHRTKKLFSLNDPTCNHKLELYSCACGYNCYISTDDSFVYDSKTNTYICEECNVSYQIKSDIKYEGCKEITTTTYLIKQGDTELFKYQRKVETYNHNYEVNSVKKDGDNYVITYLCKNCNVEEKLVLNKIEFSEYEKGLRYQYEFIPTTSGKYLFNVIGNNRYYNTNLYSGEGYVAGGSNRIECYLNKDQTYIFEIVDYKYDDSEYSDSKDVYFTISKFENDYCNDESLTYQELLDNATSCTDGYYSINYCTKCGQIHKFDIKYEHISIRKHIDLAEYGACSGFIESFTCACGKNVSYNFDGCCDTFTTNSYVDSDGHMVYVTKRTCDKCGLISTISNYSVKDSKSCSVTYYNDVIISINDRLILHYDYKIVSEEHDYEKTCSLMKSSTTCDDGIIITYTCKDCGHSYLDYAYYHAEYLKETIDLNTLNDELDGKFYLYGCACSNHNYIKYNEKTSDYILEETYNSFIEQTIDSYYDLESGNISYICNYPTYKMIFNLEEGNFVIRYTSYLEKDLNSCLMYEYTVYQFGYDEVSDTCLYELVFKTGNKYLDHNIEKTIEGNLIKYVCSDCGSYRYETTNLNDENESEAKKLEILINYPSNFSDYKSYYRLYEVTIIDSDTKTYEKEVYTYHNGQTSEKTRLVKPYKNELGSGKEHIQTEISIDKNETIYSGAYVFINNYGYYCYEAFSSGDKWYRYDYEYQFTDEECLKITNFTSNDREYRDVVNCCIKDRVIKESSTCTQDGIAYDECVMCHKKFEEYTYEPKGHNFVYDENGKFHCGSCGMESNYKDGEIILEDLTTKYGENENYVVGYYNRGKVEFTYYVAIIHNEEETILEDIKLIEYDNIRAFGFSKNDISKELDKLNISDNYLVKFIFVPYGGDSNFDYSITFN